MKKTTFKLLMCVLAVLAGTFSVSATNYCRIRVVAVGAEGGRVYAGKWSGWQTSFPTDRTTWPSELTTEVLDFSGNPDVEIVADCSEGVDFLGWFRDEECLDRLTNSGTKEKNVYGSASGIEFSTSEAAAPTTTFYAKFTSPAADWASMGVAPTAGNYYIYNIGFGGFVGRWSTANTTISASKDHNDALLFTLTDGVETAISAQLDGKTMYITQTATSLEETDQPVVKNIEAGSDFYYINLNYGKNYWYCSDGGSCSYTTKSTSSLYQRWIFIPEATYKNMVAVESLNANGTVTISDSPTGTGTTRVVFNVSEVGPASCFIPTLTGGDGHFEMGAPVRVGSTIRVPVTYTAQNIHTYPLATSAAFITLTADNAAASSAQATVSAYVNLSPAFEPLVTELDWSYENGNLVETFSAGMEVAASQRERLQHLLACNPAATSPIALNNATWTATITGTDADQFKFANGTRTATGPYSESLLDAIFAPTRTGQMEATLHVVATYTDANNTQLVAQKDITLRGTAESVSMIAFAANGNEQASANESYNFGSIIGTNSKEVTAELTLWDITGATKVWSDPDGAFEFDPNTVDLTKNHQTLTFRAHRTTPATANTDHEATLTVSGTGSEGPVSAVLTLTYRANPLLPTAVEWHWTNIKEGATVTDPISIASDATEWTLTKTGGDAEISFDAEAMSATAAYMHHEPVTKTATFALSIPQTDTYAAFEGTYTATIQILTADVLIDTPAKYNQYTSFKSANNDSWIYYTDEDKSVYLWMETIGFAFNGQTRLEFDSEKNGYTTWKITEYYADGTNLEIYSGVPADGHHVFEISPEAVEVRFYAYGWMRNIHYYEYDTIAVDYDRVVLVNDNGAVTDLDVAAVFANKQQVTVSLNAAATPYFELRSEGKPSGSSIVFGAADGLGVHRVADKVVKVAFKEGADVEAAKLATAGNACLVTFADSYTYHHEQHALPIVLMDAYDVRFKQLEQGTYQVQYENEEEPTTVATADYVKHMATVDPAYCTVTLSAPVPAEGYLFRGWQVNGNYVSFLNTVTIMLDYAATVQPVFMAMEGNYRLDDALFDDFNEVMTYAASAIAHTPIVILNRDAVLTPGNYTIPAGVSLLIPHKDNLREVQTGPDDIETNSADLEAAAKQISIYRMLTLQDGANIICNGTICVAGHAASANGGRMSGYVAKACGVINMANGGHIELNSGANLYCWGFVKGQDMDQGNNTQNIGTITANEGAVAWEDFEMGDWRGGTASSEIAFTEGRMLFPFQSYSLQNIEVPITYKYGSKLMGHATLMALSAVWPLNVAIIGSDINLFLLTDEQSTIRKWYDPTTDLVCFELSGSAQLDALVISFGIYDFNSADYNLPISNSMHIILSDCNMTLAKPMTVQAGAVLEVKPTATVNLEAPVHLYDVDEWGPYIYKNSCFRTFNTISMHKDRGSESLKDGLDDAKLIIDGTLNVKAGKGYLYATTGGANIMGNGGGVIHFEGALPSAGTLWHVTGLSDWGSSDEAAANLCNEDSSYTKTYGGYSYYNIDGRWFDEEIKDRKPDYTYDFAYLSDGNSGSTVWTSAVYSHDKTGLEARMKWSNVMEDENCADWWIGRKDGHHYNYTYLNEWHQFMATETAGVFSGSNNKLYGKDDCTWNEMGEVDENCLYTFIENEQEIKKALVNGHFIPLESNGYDPAYHAVADPSQYYICFTGCNWHPATPYPNEYKAYTIAEGGTYIWFDNDWMRVERDELYFYTADEVTNVKTYYEYLNGEWIVATPYVSVSDGTETRTFFSFQQALKVASTMNNATITVLRDFVEATNSSRTPMEFTKHNTTCTLDLNSHIAEINVEGSSATAVHMLTLNGEGSTFTITDNSPYKLGELHLKANVTTGAKASRWYGIYVQQGELILNAGKVYAENMFTYTSTSNTGVVSAIAVAGGKQFTFNNGEIEAKAPYAPYGVHMEGSTETTGKTYINNGTITATSTISSSTIGLYVGSGTAYVSDGTINVTSKTSTSRGIYVLGSTSNYIGHLEMTGGTINSKATTTTAIGIYVGGDYTFKNTKPNIIKATFRGEANISGGTINAEALGTKLAYGVNSLGSTTITGGTFNVLTKTTNSYGLLAQDGTTTISGSAVFNVKATTTTAYGIYANGAQPADKTGRPYNPEVIVNGGTFNVATLGTTTGYGINIDGNTRAITSTSSGYYAGNYASAGTVTVNDGIFNVTTTTTTCYALVVTAAAEQAGATGYDAVTATPRCTVNGGYFKTAGSSKVYAANAKATTEDFKILGGYYTHTGNLAAYANPQGKVIVTLPKTDVNYPTYKYEVAAGYTITFMDGETVLQSNNQKAGTAAVYSATEPTKANTETNSYIFDGWATEADGAVVYAKGATLPNVTADATYYAHFNETTLKYRVTWNGNSGVASEEFRYVTPGSAVGTLPTATRFGYTLKGWYTAKSSGSKIKTSTKPTADVTYYAQWTALKNDLTWELGEGVVTTAGKIGKSTVWPEVDATGTQTYNLSYAAAIVAPVVARTGYTFAGWGVPTIAATMPNEPLTYTAQWTPNTNTAYTVQHKKQNPNDLSEYTVAEEENFTGTTATYVTPSTKTYVGYITPATQTVQIAADGSLVVEYLYDLIGYTITFDANGGECATASTDVKYGATLTLPEATREGVGNLTYEFAGWFTKAVGGDQITASTIIQRNIGTLYAHFTEIEVVMPDIVAEDGESIVIDEPYIEAQGTNEVTNLIIENGGAVSVTAPIEVDNLILEGTDETSGQLFAASGVVKAENAYYDHTFNETVRHWRAFGVPWTVNIDAVPVKEVKTQDGTPVNRTLVLGRDYDIIYYNGAKRAEFGPGSHCWEYIEFGTHMLQPGKCYMIAFARPVGTLRFAKSYGSPVVFNGTLAVAANAKEGGEEDNNGWNAIANPMTYHATLDPGPTTAQVHDGGAIGSDGYELYDISDKSFVVGKAVYVQVSAAQPVVIDNAAGKDVISPASAPQRRAQSATDKRYLALKDYYSVAMKGEQDTRAAHVYVLPEEDKADEYVIGHDLARVGVGTTNSQMWINRYGVKLALNTAAPVNGLTEFPLSLYAPVAGEYTLTNEHAPLDGQDYSLYLTRDGQAVWNLSLGPCTLSLEKGTTKRYGLRMTFNSPQVATGMDEALVDAQGDTRKVLIDGQVYVIRGNKVYSVDGRWVK